MCLKDTWRDAHESELDKMTSTIRPRGIGREDPAPCSAAVWHSDPHQSRECKSRHIVQAGIASYGQSLDEADRPSFRRESISAVLPLQFPWNRVRTRVERMVPARWPAAEPRCRPRRNFTVATALTSILQGLIVPGDMRTQVARGRSTSNVDGRDVAAPGGVVAQPGVLRELPREASQAAPAS